MKLHPDEPAPISPSALADRNAAAIRVAEMYYQQQLSQKEIATELKVSAATVSRLLTFARETGLVRITLCPPRNTVLGEQLQQLLSSHGIRSVLVAGNSREAIGQATARFFEESTPHP